MIWCIYYLQYRGIQIQLTELENVFKMGKCNSYIDILADIALINNVPPIAIPKILLTFYY